MSLRLCPTALALLALLACGKTDGGGDPTRADAGSTDAGSTDAGSTDAGSTDAGSTTDGGGTDGGSTTDGAQLACEAVGTAVQAYLDSLDADQLAAGQQSFDSTMRTAWSNLPGAISPRDGLYFVDLSTAQRDRVDAMIAASLSSQGAAQVAEIISVDQWWEDNGDGLLTPDFYSVVVFGSPSATQPWGWQLDGHHLALNFTARCPALTLTPAFWGVQPELIPSGSIAGLQALGSETDAGLALLFSLDAAQLDQAVFLESAPEALFAGAGADDGIPAVGDGIVGGDLDDSQRALLLELIATYVQDADDVHAALRMAEIEADLDETWFAWAGPTDGSGLFYFRVHGPTVYIELDHSHADDHLHSVYRNPIDDYGAATLADHLARYPHD